MFYATFLNLKIIPRFYESTDELTILPAFMCQLSMSLNKNNNGKREKGGTLPSKVASTPGYLRAYFLLKGGWVPGPSKWCKYTIGVAFEYPEPPLPCLLFILFYY